MVRWRAWSLALLTAGLCACPIGTAPFDSFAIAQPQAAYVGSKACMDCHPKEYASYTKYS